MANVSAETLVQQQILEGVLDSGPRVVPLRTVVAMPAGISHPQPDSSAGSMGLLYPLLARFHQSIPRTSNDVIVSQETYETRGYHHLHDCICILNRHSYYFFSLCISLSLICNFSRPFWILHLWWSRYCDSGTDYIWRRATGGRGCRWNFLLQFSSSTHAIYISEWV